MSLLVHTAAQEAPAKISRGVMMRMCHPYPPKRVW